MLEPSGLELEELRQAPGGVRVDHETRSRKYAGGNGGPAPGFATPSRKVEIFSDGFSRRASRLFGLCGARHRP